MAPDFRQNQFRFFSLQNRRRRPSQASNANRRERVGRRQWRQQVGDGPDGGLGVPEELEEADRCYQNQVKQDKGLHSQNHLRTSCHHPLDLRLPQQKCDPGFLKFAFGKMVGDYHKMIIVR